MYNRDRWIFSNSIETEYKFAGKYGAKGEKRAKRKKATPEQMAKQNQINKENRIRRLIKANFYPSDLWVTLKYQKGTRKPYEQVAKVYADSFPARVDNMKNNTLLKAVRK